MVAAASGHKEFSVFLLDEGANPGLMAESGYTALHYAASDPKGAELVKALLDRGANPECSDHKGFTSKHHVRRRV